jgi:hypothetical protein
MKVSFLNLPKVPYDLENQIIEISRDYVTHDSDINEAGYVNRVLPEDIQIELNKIYSQHFNQRVYGIFNKMVNKNPHGTSRVSPHCDRERLTSINYFIRTGGDNVRTCFYNESRLDQTTLLTQGENAKEEQLTLDFELIFNEKQWHSYNVQKYHSVQNISNTRLLFALVLEDNIDYNTFQLKYANLINNGI